MPQHTLNLVKLQCPEKHDFANQCCTKATCTYFKMPFLNQYNGGSFTSLETTTLLALAARSVLPGQLQCTGSILMVAGNSSAAGTRVDGVPTIFAEVRTDNNLIGPRRGPQVDALDELPRGLSVFAGPGRTPHPSIGCEKKRILIFVNSISTLRTRHVNIPCREKEDDWIPL